MHLMFLLRMILKSIIFLLWDLLDDLQWQKADDFKNNHSAANGSAGGDLISDRSAGGNI